MEILEATVSIRVANKNNLGEILNESPTETMPVFIVRSSLISTYEEEFTKEVHNVLGSEYKDLVLSLVTEARPLGENNLMTFDGETLEKGEGVFSVYLTGKYGKYSNRIEVHNRLRRLLEVFEKAVYNKLKDSIVWMCLETKDKTKQQKKIKSALKKEGQVWIALETDETYQRLVGNRKNDYKVEMLKLGVLGKRLEEDTSEWAEWVLSISMDKPLPKHIKKDYTTIILM